MRIAAVLPHVEIFGGVRRYLEMGNEFSKKGHDFVLFHPTGSRPQWLEFLGRVEPFSSLEKSGFDVGLCSEYSVLHFFEKLRAKAKFFYFLLPGHKREKEVIGREYFFLGNSEGLCRRIERKYRVPCFKAAGGVNPDLFYPQPREGKEDEFRILSYGRLYKRRKGITHVIRAAERIHKKNPQTRLLLFDSLVGEERKDSRQMIRTSVPYEFYLDLPQSRMAWLYSQADVFVSAEWRAGWSNTSAEAMACRIPLVCTPSGTRDFAFHGRSALVARLPFTPFLSCQLQKLIRNQELRRRIAQEGYRRIKLFTWSALVERLTPHLEAMVKLKSERRL
jgi:glycosyltransferase involved in cell wall biosynthesis